MWGHLTSLKLLQTRISFIFRFRTHTTKSLEGLLNSEGRYSIYELVTLSDTISHNIST